MGIVVQTEKRCGKCKQQKSPADFSNCRAASDGLQNWCKQCISEYHKQRKNPCGA